MTKISRKLPAVIIGFGIISMGLIAGCAKEPPSAPEIRKEKKQ